MTTTVWGYVWSTFTIFPMSGLQHYGLDAGSGKKNQCFPFSTALHSYIIHFEL